MSQMRLFKPNDNANSLNRRHFLQLAGSASAGLWALTSCAQRAQIPVTPTSTTLSQANLTTAAEATPDAEATATAGRLRIALAIAPNLLDPARFEVIEAYPFGFAVYDALIWVDHTLKPQPMLAESWQAAPNGRSWLFKLRQGVTFHHGVKFTAHDVVYTFTRLLDPQLGSPLQPILSFVEKVEAVDDYTVRFQLSSANVELPLLLAAPQARIVANGYDAEQLVTHPSGTGPFLFTETIPRERTTFTRNPDYWDQARIHVQELQHIYIPSFDAQITALERGDVDLILDVKIDQIPKLATNPALKVVETRSGRYQNIAMRITDAPFNDPRIRQALKLCMDHSALTKQILQAHGEVGYDHPLAALSPDWAELPLPVRDINRAKQLLGEAGYADGLKLQLITAEAAPGMVELANAVQAMAQPAGIQIDVVAVKVPTDVYFSEYWGRVPFYVSAWEFRPSTYETFAVAYHSQSLWNETGWSSPDLDALLDAAHSELNEAKRKELYKKAQQFIMTEGAVMIPYFQSVLTVLRTRVEGFQPHPAGWVDLRDVQVHG